MIRKGLMKRQQDRQREEERIKQINQSQSLINNNEFPSLNGSTEENNDNNNSSLTNWGMSKFEMELKTQTIITYAQLTSQGDPEIFLKVMNSFFIANKMSTFEPPVTQQEPKKSIQEEVEEVVRALLGEVPPHPSPIPMQQGGTPGNPLKTPNRRQPVTESQQREQQQHRQQREHARLDNEDIQHESSRSPSSYSESNASIYTEGKEYDYEEGNERTDDNRNKSTRPKTKLSTQDVLFLQDREIKRYSRELEEKKSLQESLNKEKLTEITEHDEDEDEDYTDRESVVSPDETEEEAENREEEKQQYDTETDSTVASEERRHKKRKKSHKSKSKSRNKKEKDTVRTSTRNTRSNNR